VERRRAAVRDLARADVVAAEAERSTDGALRSDRRRDPVLLEAVLERDDAAVRREPGRDRLQGRGGIARLDGEQNDAEPTVELGGQRHPGTHVE